MKLSFLRKLASAAAIITLLFGWIGMYGRPAMPTQRPVLTNDLLNRQIYEAFYADAEAFAVIPGLREKTVPQAIAYSETLGAFLLTGYYEEGALPSVVCVLDGQTGCLTKTLVLADENGEPQTGHFGGAAVWEGCFYGTCGSKLYVYKTDALTALKDGDTLTAAAVYKLPDVGSFCTAGNGWLLTGTFVSEDDETGKRPVLHAYLLDADAPFGVHADENGKLIADREATAPKEVQGVALSADGKLYLSCSYGRRNDSRIHVYCGTDPAAFTDDTVFSPENADKTYIAPPMAEGMTICPAGAAIVFESGAAAYRLQRGLCPVDRILVLDTSRA